MATSRESHHTDSLWIYIQVLSVRSNITNRIDDEVPAGTQEFRVAPRASDAVGIAFEGAFVVTYGVVGIKQRGGDELSDVSLDEPVPPSWLQDDMAPLGVSELERIG